MSEQKPRRVEQKLIIKPFNWNVCDHGAKSGDYVHRKQFISHEFDTAGHLNGWWCEVVLFRMQIRYIVIARTSKRTLNAKRRATWRGRVD